MAPLPDTPTRFEAHALPMAALPDPPTHFEAHALPMAPLPDPCTRFEAHARVLFGAAARRVDHRRWPTTRGWFITLQVRPF